MRTFKIELLRFGRDAGILLDRYLVAADGCPARAVEPEFEHEQILIALDKLRYKQPHGGDADDVARRAQHEQDAIKQLRSLVAAFLEDLPDLSGVTDLTQIDIVTDKVELWALPFEFAQSKDGRDLLGNAERPVLLTRRVRRSFAERAHPWPVKPRVLFAWNGDVQYKEHRDALYTALEPWIGPLEMDMVRDTRPVFTELQAASLGEIAATCGLAAAEKRPFTHVHILAHGAILPNAIKQLETFGIAFKEEIASAEQIVAALRANASDGPTVVTLAVCDSSNASNSIVTGGRVAYQLHAQGIPVVIGSQFPLTEAGAIVHAGVFYKRLLADAADVRIALCEARAALRSSNIPGHDWASVTAHVSLPEGYKEQIGEQVQRIALEQLNTVSRWAQRIVEDNVKVSPEAVADIERLLCTRIEALEVQAQDDRNRSQASLLEDLALLASAHKRLAELVFHSRRDGSNEQSRKNLATAGQWYLRAHDQALSHHWSGTQHLAITAATLGAIPAELTVHWLSSYHAAARDAALDPPNDGTARTDAIWALGSLVELNLLRPYLASSEAISYVPEIPDAITRLIALANREPPMSWTINSTWRQLRRYVSWWTSANEFFPGSRDISDQARVLVEMLEPHMHR